MGEHEMKTSAKTLSVILTVIMLVCSFQLLLLPTANAEGGKWLATWSTSQVDPSITLSGVTFQDVIPTNSTLRTEIVVTSAGTKLRFSFSNQYGKSPVTINGANVARTEGQYKANIQEGTLVPITFGGSKAVIIPAGQRITSDVVDFTTHALDRLSISLFIENTCYISTAGLSNGRTYMNAGGILFGKSKITDASLPNATEISLGSGTITYHVIPFLEEVDSLSPDPNASCAVFIGDSTLVNDTYLDYARRIVSAGRDNISVINEAIIGNKLLSNGSGLIGKLYGDAMIDRYKRDVLDVPGVKYCFVKIGLNDVLHQFSKSLAAETPKYSTDQIIAGYRTLIEQAHQRGIRIYFFTKSPWNGYKRSFLGQSDDLTWNQTAQDMCNVLSEWVRTNTLADGYIDCLSLADPSDNTKLCSTFTPDGAHLTDLGSVALADLIPLEYVGVNSAYGSSAAALLNVNPYAEKNEILQRLISSPAATAAPAATTQRAAQSQNTPAATQQSAAATASTTAKSSSTANNSTTTTKQSSSASSTTASATTTEVTTNTGATPSTYTGVTEEPFTSEAAFTYSYSPASAANGMEQDVNYNVLDESPAEENVRLGSGAPIAFILILLMVLMIAAAVVVLTVGRRNEEESEI